MKTLREYIDQLDEISRRDFLKGAGAAVAGAAVGQAKDAQALSYNPRTNTFEFDLQDMEYIHDLMMLHYLCQNHPGKMSFCKQVGELSRAFNYRYRGGQGLLAQYLSQIHRTLAPLRPNNEITDQYIQAIAPYIAKSDLMIKNFQTLVPSFNEQIDESEP